MINKIRSWLFPEIEVDSNKKAEETEVSDLTYHENAFIEKIILLLMHKKDEWSLTWHSGTIQSSIRYKKDILIMIETAEILFPLRFKPSKEKADIIIGLINTLVERDKIRILKKIINE